MRCEEKVEDVLTVQGLSRLDAEITEWETTLSASQRKAADRDARGCGSINGMTLQDDVSRQHEIYRGHINRLKHYRRRTKKIPEPTECKVLGIGTVGTFLYSTLSPERHGIEHRIQLHIVGRNEHDCSALPKQLLYDDEVAQQFLNEPVGYSSEVFFDGKVRTVRLTAIRLITDKRVIRELAPESVAT